MPVILVKVIDFQIMNRYYNWKLQFLHAFDLCKITIILVLDRNISLPNKILLVSPFWGFPPMTKVTIFFLILSFTSEVSAVLRQWLFKEPWMTESIRIRSMTHAAGQSAIKTAKQNKIWACDSKKNGWKWRAVEGIMLHACILDKLW